METRSKSQTPGTGLAPESSSRRPQAVPAEDSTTPGASELEEEPLQEVETKAESLKKQLQRLEEAAELRVLREKVAQKEQELLAGDPTKRARAITITDDISTTKRICGSNSTTLSAPPAFKETSEKELGRFQRACEIIFRSDTT
ncbi:MAG: hypothetical protein M1837_001293 [Sclerophora amabilis]|nr:MAG: hypothetical protein M1837_001293 [Sclerophora amabilis]